MLTVTQNVQVLVHGFVLICGSIPEVRETARTERYRSLRLDSVCASDGCHIWTSGGKDWQEACGVFAIVCLACGTLKRANVRHCKKRRRLATHNTSIARTEQDTNAAKAKLSEHVAYSSCVGLRHRLLILAIRSRHWNMSVP